MIEAGGEIVGAVWVDMDKTNHLPAPAIHLMVGDTAQRGQGVGSAALEAVLEYLQNSGVHIVYSRRTLQNKISAKLLAKMGFEKSGKEYFDDDGLRWQNVARYS